jgi:hypothetical protein
VKGAGLGGDSVASVGGGGDVWAGAELCGAGVA